MLTQAQVIERFCRLSARVGRVQFRHEHAADCFCDFRSQNPLVTAFNFEYQFAEAVMTFIENAVEAKLPKGAQMFDIENVFQYHAPHGTQQARYVALREKAKEFALLIEENCPDSREKSLAMTSLQQTVMWANTAIAINET